MGIVITGASGFVGREIVPLLASVGQKLLLVGRDVSKLENLFPGAAISNYADLASKAEGFETLLHLAVLNNDKSGTLDEFQAVNVTLLKDIVKTAKKSGVKTFIYTSTIQAMDPAHHSPYAQSKREAEGFLGSVKGINIANLRLPVVYGDAFAGKLAILSKCPKIFRQTAFKLLASLKPTVHAKLIVQAILDITDQKSPANIIVSDRQNNNWFYAALKRAIDLSFVFFIIVFFWWALVLAWIAVKFSSPGPGIFSQVRVGKNEKPFTCYKFRTMAQGTEQAGTHEISASNITPVGGFLRKTKIDELPQIWNILKNELSLVGPRPCLPIQQELIDARSQFDIFAAKGGISGWAQIQGIDMSDPSKLAKLDAEYLALRSTIFDLKIIFWTAVGRGQGDRVKKTRG